jgi:hypothetical protein
VLLFCVRTLNGHRVECPLDGTKSLTCFDGMAYDWDFDVRGEEIQEDSETATAMRRMSAQRETDSTILRLEAVMYVTILSRLAHVGG